jgi:hypothetical protein
MTGNPQHQGVDAMSNANGGNNSTNSGQGALGMGGQPSDDPRDSERGGGGVSNLHDDRGGGTGPIPGAHGRGQKDFSGGNVAGVKGDKAVDQAIQNEAEGDD